MKNDPNYEKILSHCYRNYVNGTEVIHSYKNTILHNRNDIRPNSMIMAYLDVGYYKGASRATLATLKGLPPYKDWHPIRIAALQRLPPYSNYKVGLLLCVCVCFTI